MENWRERLSIDPQICHGRICIKGTRVMVSVVLDNLADGESIESITSGYNITNADVQAAVKYAAELARERVIYTAGATP